MEELIAQRYANALLAAGGDGDKLKQYVAELSNLSTTICNMPSLEEVLHSPIINNDKKTELVLLALDKKVDTHLVNFIKILGEKKRLYLLPIIVKLLNAQLQKESNLYQGVVQSRGELEESDINQLQETLYKFTGSTVVLSQDTKEIDGLRVLVEDLGIEVNFSKQRVKEQLIDFINRSL